MGRLSRAVAASFSAREHDHGNCVAEAMRNAERICARRGVRLTKLRYRVLELVWSSHAPIGAYGLLERLNAFIGCADPSAVQAGQFLICRDCGAAAELHDPRVNRAITRGASEVGFVVEGRTVEVSGICPACQTEEGAVPHVP